MHKLAIKYLSEEGPSTVLFEPTELIDFQSAWDWQKNWQKALLADPSSKQAIWMLEHFHCFTLGRAASKDNLLFDSKKTSVDLYRIDRGGEVTHHLPGQLVVYLVLDLHRYKTDLNWYLRELEAVLIDVLADLGLIGQRMKGLTGVWCEGKKVGAIGVGCKRWVTQHGLALNVNCDLSGFNEIIPCGLSEHPIGKINEFIPEVKMREVRFFMKKNLSKHFGLL
ncbi:lipoyl(octanoyl) transferase LipB [Prochlorococcus marinus]|uniref:lipoyl(octanoyl) transferase LipB n=1 Tax=Prochlorococcus marinus TaxID=1219 RepID=UPI0022B4A9CE|nr:lipoyl(octanoyl) transferase LipB [Prochlorococcus marinus]